MLRNSISQDRNLADAHFRKGQDASKAGDKEAERTNYESAISILEQLEKKEIVDWSALSRYYCFLGCLINNSDAVVHYNKTASLIQSCIPSADRIPSDWSNLFTSLYNAGIDCKNPNKTIWYCEQAIAIISQLPADKRLTCDWRIFALCFYNIGHTLYLNQKDWPKALINFQQAVDIWIVSSRIEYPNYELVANIYSHLLNILPSNSLLQKMYQFAYDIFKNTANIPAITNIMHFYIAISMQTTPNIMVRALLQLMQLIALNVRDDKFPNKELKDWLAIPESLQAYQAMQKTIEAICKPASLLDATTQAPSFSIAVANKLNDLDAKVTLLKKQNKKLSTSLKTLTKHSHHGLFSRVHLRSSTRKKILNLPISVKPEGQEQRSLALD